MNQIPPHPLNTPGDFYVQNDMCLMCTAPEHEAPELMSHDETGHCYFCRQPESAEELAHAVRAVQVGCCGAVRYGGRDSAVIARLFELKSADDCDHA